LPCDVRCPFPDLAPTGALRAGCLDVSPGGIAGVPCLPNVIVQTQMRGYVTKSQVTLPEFNSYVHAPSLYYC
jgi:hypothetical protein